MKKAIVLAVLFALLTCVPAYAAVEAYGTFECMGVIADAPAGYTAAQIGQVKVYLSKGAGWERAQDAVQVAAEEYFASSLFGLTPGTSYTVKVEFYDLSNALVATQYGSGTTRNEISIPATASSVYVSPAGSDSGAGTIGAPFATLGHAISVATAGTTIYLRGGTYYEGEIHPTVSGTQAAPIVIRAYGSETPVLEGADPSLISTAWTGVQPQVYSNPFAGVSWNLCLVRKSDQTVFRAYPMATVAEVTSETSAGYTFAELNIDAAYCTDGATLTVRVPAGTIADYDVYVSRFETGIYLENTSFIYLDGLTLTHYGSGDYGRGVYINSSSDILVQRCRFLYNNSGIMIKNASYRDVIQDNYCLDDVADWHFSYTKSMAVVYSDYVETGLVVMAGTYSGRGLVIRRNDINGTFDGSEINPYTSFTGKTVETDFYDNKMHHIFDDFLELDGYSRNVRVFRNDMHSALSGISLAQALDGPTWIIRNQIIDCGTSAAGKNPNDVAWEGYPFKTNGGPHPEIGSGPAFFYHNTAYTTDPVGLAMLVKSNVLWKKFTFRNNIWVGQVGGFEHWSGALSPWDWDYDDLYMYSGPSMVISGTTYATLADAQAGTGYLPNGISAEPQFVNAVSEDFHIAATSPCVDRGVLVPGINDNYTGAAPDMGAFELDDADGDGLPDAWEIAHFGNLLQGPTDDPDGDGYINLAEYRNGTNPAVAETLPPYVSAVTWTPVGPGGGGAQYNPSIAPNNPNLMYGFCDMGGVYRSRNGGRDWEMYTFDNAQMPMAYSPTHCNPVFNPFDERICFIGLDEGLRRTIDGGDTWQLVTSNSPTAVTIDRSATNVVFYASNANRLYKSTDGGTTWSEVSSWYSSVNQTVIDLFVDASTPASNLTIYAATWVGLYKSTNGGTTWAAANGNLPDTNLKDFNAAMKDGLPVLYVTVPVVSPLTANVYKSTDGGATWTQKATGLSVVSFDSVDYQNELAICDSDADVVYVGSHQDGGPAVYKTIDGGDHWTMVLTDPGAADFPAGVTVERDWMTLSLGWGWGEEPHEIEVCPTDPNYVAFSEDGRTWRSDDGGKNWFCCNSRETANGSNWWPSRGFETTTNYRVHFAPWDHNRAYITYTDMGFFRSEDRAYSWRPAWSGSPYRNTFYDVAFDPTIAGKMWATSSNNHDLPHDKMLRSASFLTFSGAFLKSTDYGATWTSPVYPRGVNGGAITSIVVDPTSPANNRTIYTAIMGHGVYKSTDDGVTWASASTGLTMPSNNNAWQLRRMSDGTLYCAMTMSRTGGGHFAGALFKSTDGAANWTKVNTGQQMPYICGFDVDPTNQNVIYVASFQMAYNGEQGLYKTTNGGTTWTRTLALGDMYGADIDPELHTRVYATIEQGEDFWPNGGIYMSENSGTTWTKLPGFPFERYGPNYVSFDPDNSEIIYVTTFGGGVFKGQVAHAAAASAGFTSVAGPLPLQITFSSATSTGSINTYYWQFGDGAVSLAANPVHTYAASGTHTVTLSVQGPNGVSAVTHDVVAADALAVATTTLAGSANGAAYSQTLAAAGGAAPYTWAITAGALPTGLSLNASTGEISGTCGAEGTFDFTVEVTDSTVPTPQTATKDLQIIIAASNPSVTTAALPGGTDAAAYSQTLAATGGIPPYSWSVIAGSLPTGLTLNATTGIISGTAFRSGTFNFTVQVADSQLPSGTGTKALSIVIAASDTDADGLPDGWELQQFGNLAQGPGGDPDGDGWTNLQEYLGGSDPNVADTVPPVGMARPHPRLWMEAGSSDPVVADMATVIARSTAPAYSGIWTSVTGSANVANQGLTYLVNGDAGKLASVKTALSSTTTDADQLIYRSLAFDWAYGGLTPAERAAYAANLVASANSIIDANTYLYGNYGIRYQAASAIAAIAAAGDADVSVLWPKAYDRMVDVMQITGDGAAPGDMEGRAAYGGGWPEGYDYNRHTQIHMLQYLQALRSAFGSHEDKLSASAWAQGVVKYMIYGVLPDGSYVLPYGDIDWPYLLDHDRAIVLLATDATNSQHGQYWLNHVYGTSMYWAYTDMIFYDAARGEQSFDTLPKGEYFAGIGLAVFRSGWGPNDTYVAFKSSDYHTYHQNNGQNAFYIYKSAPLAVRTGVYDGNVHDHNVNYLIRTIAQNSVTVFDPTETYSNPGIPDDNDGGQMVQEWTGEHHNFAEWRAQANRVGTPRNIVDWVDYQLGANYGYAAAEAGRAYEAGKVPFFSRQLLWLDPDWILVFDRVTSGDASFQKKFHLHSPEAMTLSGDTATILTTTAPGTTAPAKLFCKNLLPSGAGMALVGGAGNEFFYNGRNHPGPAPYNNQIQGLWRLEESAPLTADTYFLNVMYATPAATAAMPPVQTYKETAGSVTVAVNNGQYVVRFDKTGPVNWAFDTLDALTITTTTLPGGLPATGYSETLAATGGLGPYAWAITAGTLPTGLSLNGATGVISGICSASGTFNFTVEATDSAFTPSTATQALQIVVAVGPLSITTASLPATNEGTAYSQTVAATGGVMPYRWYVSSGALPRGITLNSATGALSGYAYAPGTYNFRVKVWDARTPSESDSKAFTIAVGAADTDGDGLADGWEMEHFGNLAQGPTGDPDADGYINIAEYRNGSNPTQIQTVPAYLANVNWISVGPGGGGAQYNPTAAPNNPDLMVGVCDMGGFYRSTDGGRHWTMVNGADVNLIPSYRDTDCGPEFHPANENLLLVARAEGLARSTDGGLTYAKVSDTEATALAWHGANQSVAFFAGSDNKLYRSGDGGATWSEVAGWNAVAVRVRELYVDSSTAAGSETIFASTGSGVYKTTDGGANWSPANTGLGSTDIVYMDGGMKAGVAIVYCVADDIVYRSADGAATWTAVMNGLAAGPTYGTVATCETDPDIAYVGASESGEPTIYKTSDGGANWTLKLISPSSGRFPVTTTVERDWITLALGWDWGGDAHDIDVCATDPRVVAFGEDGRTWRSDDGGDTWFCCNNEEKTLGSNWWRSVGFETTNAYGYVVDPRDATRHYIPYTDIGFARSVDSGDSWRWAATGSPWRNTFYDIACDPTVAGRMWAVASNNHDLPHHKMLRQNVNNFNGGVLISNNWGASWTDLGHATGLPTGAATSVVVDPTSPDTGRTLWVTILAKGVYKSTDGGATWVAKNNGLGMPSNMNVWQIERMSDGTLYCALTVAVSGVLPGPFTYYKGGLFKSTDGGDNWTLVNASQDLPWIVGFSVDPTDQNKIYVGCFEPDATIPLGGGWRTTDGGANWQRIIDTPYVWKITIDPEKPSRLWAGIQVDSTLWAVQDYDGESVRISEDGGDTWTPMPTFPFTAYGAQQAVFDPADSQNVFVTTFGGGVFKGVVPHVTAPVGAFSATAGPLDLEVTFDSSATTGDVNTYFWQFGDGQTSMLANPVHTYAVAGVYTVTLSVQGPAGVSTVSHDVTAATMLSVTTNLLPAVMVGQSYSETVAALGGTAPYSWAVTSGSLPAGLSFDAGTGVVSGIATTAGAYNFTVTATDSAVGTTQTASKALEITVNACDLTVSTAGLPNGQTGTAYSAGLAATGGTPGYSWEIASGALPAGLTLDGGTGVISGTPTTTGTSNFTVRVTDSSPLPQQATRGLSIVISAPGLLITTTALADGQEGVAYSETVAATGGVPPYTWSVSGGTLPAGLSIDAASGVISGTPSAYGTSNFTAMVTDSQGTPETDTQDLSITVLPPTLTITTASLAGGKVGVAYSQTLTSTGGAAPRTWSVSAGSLPAGLALDGATGVISGTPTAHGTAVFTVHIGDSWAPANTATKDLSIAVDPADLVITTASLAAGAEGQAYSANLAATGGVAPYTWFVARTDMPRGLVLDVNTGELSGRPFESGAFTVTYQVTDSQGFPATAQKALAINIAAADTDGDGLPDGWEYEHFGNLLQGANGDPDADGYVNLAEYRNNTNPTVAETLPPYIAGARWTNVGLGGGGAMYNPVIAPGDAGLMYANCDMGGFYRSIDGGRHFRMIDGTKVNSVTSYSPDSCVPVFAGTDPNTIYVGRIGGLLKSSDAGVTWTKLTGQYDVWSGDIATAIAVDGADLNYVLAGFNGYNLTAGQYLIESRNAGATWNTVAGWTAVGEGIREIWIDPTTPPASATIYISTGNGMYKSTDGGANWSPANNGLAATDIIDFAGAVKGGSAVLYCVVPSSLDVSNHLVGGPYKSTDGGASWQQIKTGLTEEQGGAAVLYSSIGVSASNPDVAYLGSHENGGPTVYRTTDGGANWEMVLTHPAWRAAETPTTTVENDWVTRWLDWGWGEDPHQVCVSPTNPACVAITEDGRAFRSDNGGQHWFPCFTEETPAAGDTYQTRGLDVTNVYRYAIDPLNAQRHYLANTDMGLSKSVDGGVTWKWSSTGSPWRNTFYDLAFDGEVDGRMWAAVSNQHDAPQWKVIRQDVPNLSGGIVISNDAGDTWAEIGHGAGGLPNGMATSIAIDPTSTAANRRMWATVMGHGVYETNDGGATWVARNNGLGTADDMNAWMVKRYSNGNLYCAVTMALDGTLTAHPGGLWKSIDGGANWTQVNLSQMIPWPVSFDIDPNDENVIYIAGFMGSSGLNNGGVWKTTDGGTTWNLVVNKQDCFGVAIDPSDSNRVYAGVWTWVEQGEGQFISTDAGATWARMPGLPFTNGGNLTFFDPADSQNVFAATIGGGAWKARIVNAAAPVAGFTATPASGGAPLDVTFDASSSTGDVNTYAWDFDDGAESNAAGPSHSYAADGAYTVSLTVSGPNGHSTITHLVTVSTLSITTATLADATDGAAYNETLGSSGGIAPITWSISAGALPAGLALDPATGVISGTPTVIGTASFTVEAADSSAAGQTVSQALSISVNPAGLVITTNSLPDGQVGTAYSTALAATGGVTPYTWGISAGALPAGLSLDSATGVISGTPTINVVASFTVRVVDSDGVPQVVTKALSITVTAAKLTITTATLAPGLVGSAYSESVNATGGIPPYTWSISAGSLPAGLSLNGVTGVISGTPTAYGTSAFTVMVVDSQGTPDSDTKALSITIAAADLVITTASLPSGTTGVAYNQSVSAVGGETPYTWSITGGSLPTGLALNTSTGAISGMPTAGGTFNFTIQVADAQATPDTATADLSIVIGAGADTDGDGLPDAWEMTYFGNLDQGAYDDPDDDGWYNITEYLRGSDPTVQTAQDLLVPNLALANAHPRLWVRGDTSNPFVASRAQVVARTTGAYVSEWNLVKSSTALWNVALTHMLAPDPAKLATVKTALATTTTNADTLVERALAYDWVWSSLTAGERSTYAANLVTSGYNVRGGTGPAANMYTGAGVTKERAAAMAALAAAGTDGRAQALFDLAYAAMMKFRGITGDGFDMTSVAERRGRAGYGGGWPEGYNFDRLASRAALQFYAALRSAVEQDFIHNSRYWRDKVYFLVYGTTPDGGHFAPWDDNDTVYFHRFDREEMLMLAGDLVDGHGQYWLNHFNSVPIAYSGCVELIFKSKTLAEANFSSLPAGRFFEGIGMSVLRSGWSTSDTMTSFKASNWYTGHQNNAAGAFMIYKTAPLSTKSGIYDGQVNDHYINYVLRTISYNALTVRRPGELFFAPANGTSAANDGGQMVQQWSSDPVDVAGWRAQAARAGNAPNGLEYPDREIVDSGDFDVTTQYAYAAAQFNKAYETGKVDFASRQVLFVKPDWIIVFDRVTPSNASYERKFVLHSGEGLTVNGDKAVITVGSLPGTTAAGKLFMRNLLSTDSTVSLVGGTGFEYYYDGTNHPTGTAAYGDQIGGKWRLEESKPAEASSCFLNVFYAAAGTVPDMPTAEIVSDTVDSVTLSINSGQTLITFNKTGAIGYDVQGGLPVEITTTTLAAATQDSPYTAAIGTSGGTVPFTWSLTAGALPAGLTLNAVTGVISGTPTVAGTYNFTVQVVDSAGTPTSDTQALSIVVGATNHAPVISGLPDLTTAEDTAVSHAIDLWSFASDAETATASLAFSISNITNASAGVSIEANRYINLSPSLHWNGSATVTVQVSDGSLAATDQFVVTVTAVNSAPAFAPLPDVTTSENVPVSHAIDLWTFASDPETAASGLAYSLVSVSDAQAGVTIGSNRYVNVNPALNWNGSATVVVRVSDGLLSNTGTFTVTVNAVNQPPAWTTIPTVTTPENTPALHAVDLWAYVSDPETADASLVFTLVSSSSPEAGVTLEANRWINVNPANLWHGSSAVRVRASDGASYAATDFTVNVTFVNQPPVLTHTPVTTATESSAVTITAAVVDPDSTPVVTLYYRKTGVASYMSKAMPSAGGDNYSTTIPASAVRPPSLEYYVSATDAVTTPTAGPYTITVTPLPDSAAPVVSGLSSLPTRIVEGVDTSLAISAFVDDSTRGNSILSRAEYFVGADPGQGLGTAMAAADGAFDEVSEGVIATINTSAWTIAASPYVIHVRADDDDGNWSAPVDVTVQVVGDIVPPAAVTDLAVTVPPVSTFQLVPATIEDVSSEVAPVNAASMAVDGDTGSFWSSVPTASSTQEYITIDLGANYEIGKITLHPGGKLSLFPASFKVKVISEAGPDGPAQISTVVTEYGYAAMPGANSWQIERTRARYVRLEAEETVLDSGPGLYSVEIGEIQASEVFENSNSLLLTWTAPGDDGSTGQATSYDIRYSTTGITAVSFNAAASVTDEPAPQTAGAAEGYEFRNLAPDTRYFIALKAADEAFNWSAISNVVSAKTAPRYVEGIILLAPADETAMPVSSIPTFRWESSAYNRYSVEISNSPAFPATPTTLPDGKVIRTVSWSLGNTYDWTPTVSQWRTVKNICSATGGTAYWRVRGTNSRNPALGVLYSQTWHTYSIEGGVIACASPADGFLASITARPAFSWTYNGTDMAKYWLQFSNSPAFTQGATTFYQCPSTGVAALTYTPTAADWKSVKKLAMATGGQVYWRVKGADASGAFELWSDTRTLTIFGGTITLLPPIPNGDGTVPHATPSPQFSWNYVGSGFYRFYVQFSIAPGFPANSANAANSTLFLPSGGVLGSPMMLGAAQWQKVLTRDATVGDTMYWRVKAIDQDGVFYIITPPSSFVWR